MADGAEALARVRDFAPDVVLTDVMMPGLDGFGLLAALRADAATATLPVIMLSARAGQAASIEGLDAGADDYLIKPFSAMDLRTRVRGLVNLVHRRREASTAQERAHGDERARMQATTFDTALSNTADFVYTFDLEGRFTYVNRALLDLWGRRLDEALGCKFHELGYPPDLADRLQRQIQEVIRTRSLIRDETPFEAASVREYEYIFVPVLGPDNQVVAVGGSTRDVTDQRRLVQQLRENDRRKDEFLAMLAHELRNPLAAVGNAASLLKMSSRPETVAHAAGVIDRNVRQFARLIDDLLDVSRISSGKIQLRHERVDLEALVCEAVATVRQLVDERRHDARVDVEGDGLYVEGDPMRLLQVAVNLLANAAKYTPDGGHIVVRLWRDGGDVVLSVSDDGIGIAAEQMDEMFDLFAQGERGLARSEGGLGVGLTIVRKLVDLHGGHVTGSSEGRGRGSRFVVRLPAIAVSMAPSASEDASSDTAPHTRVLVVDDNVDAADTLAQGVAVLGHEVRIAYDGPQAIAIAQAFDPSLCCSTSASPARTVTRSPGPCGRMVHAR